MSEVGAARPSSSLQFWSFVLPVLKCAVCPACLSVFGGLFAGARLGVGGDERFHGWIIAGALVADYFILRAALKHHKNRWPLLWCVLGGSLAVVGHFASESLEYVGFALLMVAAFYNVYLLRQHGKQVGSCCAHDPGGLAPPTRQVGYGHEHS